MERRDEKKPPKKRNKSAMWSDEVGEAFKGEHNLSRCGDVINMSA